MMEKQYLTLKQNLCSARLFLNLFGLFLERTEEINEFSQIKIFLLE